MTGKHEPMPPSYWFPAKRYGWGWGPPCAWQGWVVVVAWILALALGLVLLRRASPLGTGAFIGAMSVLLILICWLTGEPPGWRSGGPGKKP